MSASCFLCERCSSPTRCTAWVPCVVALGGVVPMAFNHQPDPSGSSWHPPARYASIPSFGLSPSYPSVGTVGHAEVSQSVGQPAEKSHAATQAGGPSSSSGQAGDIVIVDAIFMVLYTAAYWSAVAASMPPSTMAACGQHGLLDPKTSVPGLGQHRVEHKMHAANTQLTVSAANVPTTVH
jgi:hypothetical protein